MGLGLVALGGACSQVKSNDVKTDAIAATLQATSQGNGETVVTASLQVGSDYVTLSGGDALTATDNGVSATFTQSANLFGQTSFTATVATDDPGSTLTVAFNRTGNTSAPNSNVVMPPAFTMTSPNASQGFSRSGDTIPVAWNVIPSSNTAISWAASGPCIANAGASIAAGSESVSIPPGTLQTASGLSAPVAPCTVTLTVSFTVTGTVDPAFASGSAITASEEQSVQFTSGV